MSYQRSISRNATPPQAKGQCTAVLGGLTKAMQAEQILHYAAIPAHLTKVSSQMGGCVYGVILSCLQADIAREILAQNGISVRRMLSL